MFLLYRSCLTVFMYLPTPGSVRFPLRRQSPACEAAGWRFPKESLRRACCSSSCASLFSWLANLGLMSIALSLLYQLSVFPTCIKFQFEFNTCVVFRSRRSTWLPFHSLHVSAPSPISVSVKTQVLFLTIPSAPSEVWSEFWAVSRHHSSFLSVCGSRSHSGACVSG